MLLSAVYRSAVRRLGFEGRRRRLRCRLGGWKREKTEDERLSRNLDLSGLFQEYALHIGSLRVFVVKRQSRFF